MKNKFVPIAAFTHAADAVIARGLLEKNGIACRTFEEKLPLNAPHYKGVSGKSLVQVQRKNLARAVQILKEKGHLRSEDFCASKWNLLMAKIFSTS